VSARRARDRGDAHPPTSAMARGSGRNPPRVPGARTRRSARFSDPRARRSERDSLKRSSACSLPGSRPMVLPGELPIRRPQPSSVAPGRRAPRRGRPPHRAQGSEAIARGTCAAHAMLDVAVWPAPAFVLGLLARSRRLPSRDARDPHRRGLHGLFTSAPPSTCVFFSTTTTGSAWA
jgi:hypothetical protein